jgi:catechol 2,3-dioxygenase-like lactoylglutathione lyase family enzyme
VRVRHIGIVCKDLLASLQFYCDFLGYKIYRQIDEAGEFISTILGSPNIHVKTVKLSLSGGNTQIELLVFDNPKIFERSADMFVSGLTHFALQVDNVDSLYKKLIRHNVFFISPPQLSDDGLAKVCFCRDPDGVFIELVELV